MKYRRRFWRRRPSLDLTNLILILLVIAFIRAFLLEIIIFGTLALTIWLVVRLRQRFYLRQLDLQGVDELSPYQFEDFVGELFRAKGYRVEVTQRSKDWGADVIARSPKGQRVAIQVKHSNKGRPIGVDAVQEVFTSTTRCKCGRAMVVTNSTFTESARELARDAKVELWDRSRLAKEVTSMRRSTSASPLVQLASPGVGRLKLPMANSTANQPSYCPDCGAELVARKGKYGPFLGCSRYPECMYTRNQ